MKTEQPRRATPSVVTAVSVSSTHPALPRPRVMLDASHFAQEAERRYSVRFMRGIEPRLLAAHAGAELARTLTRRLGTLDRVGLEHEGRLLDALLEGAHPRQALLLHELLRSLQAAVTRGGVSVAPNAEGSWTISPPGEEPYAFSDEHSRSCLLPDGVRCQVIAHALLLVGEQPLSRQLALQTAALSPREVAVAHSVLTLLLHETGVTTLAAAGSFASVISASGALVQQAPQLLGLASAMMTHAGLEAPSGIAEVDRLKNEHRSNDPVNTALLLCCAAVFQLATAPTAVAEELSRLLRRRGQSAAPSSRADAGAETAALFACLAACPGQLSDALPAIRAGADRVRGAPRADVLAETRAVLQTIARNELRLEAALAWLGRR